MRTHVVACMRVFVVIVCMYERVHACVCVCVCVCEREREREREREALPVLATRVRVLVRARDDEGVWRCGSRAGEGGTVARERVRVLEQV